MRRIILALSFLMFVATAIAVAQSNDDNPVFLPAITANGDLVKGYVKSCETTHAFTEVRLVQTSVQYHELVYSSALDGAVIGRTEQGILRLSDSGPIAGNWWFWLTDSEGRRISEGVSLTTQAEPGLGLCQQASLVFYGQPETNDRPYFNIAIAGRCDPNGAVTYVQGKTYVNGVPTSGDWYVAFSYAPDGPIVAKIKAGPHAGYETWDEGFYSHILQSDGPRAGTWYFWVTDSDDKRISEMANLNTDAEVGPDSCQQAIVDFDSR